MNFDISRSIEVLSSTPVALRSMLSNLSEPWTSGETASTSLKIEDRTWEPFDVVGHLIHAEDTDWIARARIILDQGDDIGFAPFDRFAQFENSSGKSLLQLLDEFDRKRIDSLDTLRSWNLTDEQLDLEGIHPELGRVKLRQLLATWVVHDLTHVRQIATVMAKKYESEVGSWKEYLSILK